MTSARSNEEALNDSMRPPVLTPADKQEASSSLVGTGPIAYGTVWSDGTKTGGTSNWSSTYNAGLKRYEIAISGVNYYYLSYATVVTALGDVRICTSGSVDGKLLVECYDHAGNPTPGRFAFVTSKP